MATVWIRGGLIAWLKGAPETRRIDTPLRGRPEEGDEALYDQAALDAAIAAEREACAMVCDDAARYWHQRGDEARRGVAAIMRAKILERSNSN